MMPFLVLRPEPGASATAHRIRERGGEAIVAPLFAVEPLEWVPPPAGDHDALMITSANTVRHAGAALRHYRTLPVYAVGKATAMVLTEAGFEDVRVGTGDLEGLLACLAADGRTAPLHLAGEDVRQGAHPALTIIRVPVYRSRAIDPGSLPDQAVALLHSPRAAARFAALADHARFAVAAISEVALTGAGDGWRASIVAAEPTEEALLAAAFALCEDADRTTGRG